jgi:thiamine biosynthesis lipoprotein
MSAPAAAPAATSRDADRGRESITRSFVSMASPITLRLVEPGPGATAALDRAEAVVREVARTCTRFEPSALTRANADPDRWHEVPEPLARAVEEAARAHEGTGGRFDPRVLETLLAWGYDRTLPDHAELDAAAVEVRPPADGGPWRPRVRTHGGRWHVRLGSRPIDLGGIAKGLAVRWAGAELAGAAAGHLVNAGGDLVVGGLAPQDGGWTVGVEDPAGGDRPVLVLALDDAACATSSVRRLRWRVGAQQVHHLIDPRTGLPGGDGGLLAVTVVDHDPASAEVLSKDLFLTGLAQVRRRADRSGHPVAWVTREGVVGTTAAMDALVTWRRSDG